MTNMLKRFLITLLILLLSVSLIGMTIYYQQVSNDKTIFEIQAVESLNGQNEQILNEFTYIVTDLMYLAKQYELQNLLDNYMPAQQQILAQEYRLFAAQKRLYDQIRFFDDTGMEIARANFNAGHPSIVPPSKLQSKGKRYYFRDTVMLSRNEVFISPFDLNIEKGQIEQPLKPMIRFGTSVFDHTERKRGILLLNYLGTNLLQKLDKTAASASNHIMLTNAAGFWLKGLVPEDEWGFMYKDSDKKTFGNYFPNEWHQIQKAQSGQFYTNNGLFTFITIYPLLEGQKSSTGAQQAYSPSLTKLEINKYYWKIISLIPQQILQAKSRQTLTNMTMPFITMVLLIVVISVFLSHTHLKRAEAEVALQASEERFKTIVCAIPIPMTISRIKDGSLLYINEHYKKCFNISPERVENHKFYHNFVNPDDKQRLLTILKQDNYVHNLEFQTKKLDGKPFWIIASFRHIIFDGESAMVGTAYDITERKLAEEKIQQQHKFLQQVIDSLDHPFYVINANNYRIELANSATQALGLLAQTTCHKLTHQRNTPCTGKNDLCPLQEVKKTNKPVLVEHIHFDKNGHFRNVEVHGFPITNSAGDVTQMIEYSLDITERKQAEKQLHQQNEELQTQNERLDAFARQLEELQQEKLYQLNKAYERFVPNEFLALLDKQSIIEVQLGEQIEKEITILFADIRNFTNMSEKMTPQENFDFINAYLSRMEPVISSHHGFIDKYIGDGIMALFPTNADDALQAAINMLKRLAGYNLTRGRPGRPIINIGIGINAGLLMLGTVGGQNRMDGTVISDAVNLASRVEQLTKIYGASLLITEHTYVKLVDPHQYCIRMIDIVKVKGKSEKVTIYEVFDADVPEMIALKNETLSHFKEGFAFYHCNKFNDAKPFFEKVLQINPNDKTVQFYLAQCQKALSMTIPETPEILLVDDTYLNLIALVHVLKKNNLKVRIADDGENALKAVELKHPHLILLDVKMPNMDGFEVCKQLKANPETKDIPIIFMTSLAETTDKVKGFELGAVDYITKPIQHEEALIRIKTHLHLGHLQQRASWYIKQIGRMQSY